MNRTKILDYIGAYAPVLLFVFTAVLLRHTSYYLSVFVIGFLLNNVLNIVLKLLIKEPRPDKDQKALEIAVVNGSRIWFDKFGMPSGHAQNCGYFLTFVTFVLDSPIITSLYALVSLLSVLQRHAYDNHTVLQLLVGFVIGCGVGYGTYWVGQRRLVGDTQPKKDDDGPR